MNKRKTCRLFVKKYLKNRSAYGIIKVDEVQIKFSMVGRQNLLTAVCREVCQYNRKYQTPVFNKVSFKGLEIKFHAFFCVKI